MKYDGFRLFAYRLGRETRLLSRNGKELGVQFPELVAALGTIATDCILDGALTVCDADGSLTGIFCDRDRLKVRASTARPQDRR